MQTSNEWGPWRTDAVGVYRQSRQGAEYMTADYANELEVKVRRAEGLKKALQCAVSAFEFQVMQCHAREAAFQDVSIYARPMDWAEVAANIYAATAEPLTQARAALQSLDALSGKE